MKDGLCHCYFDYNFFELIYKIGAGSSVSFPFCLYSYIMSLLSKIYTLQPAFSRTLVRSHSTKSTHFLNDFMTSKEKGPIQISIENKVIINHHCFQAL